MRRMMRIWTIALLSLLALTAHAQTTASLSRNKVRAGETVTLTVATTTVPPVEPDYSLLERDFVVGKSVDGTENVTLNGQTVTRALFGVPLTPKRSGTLTIPALVVGAERTQPLTLVVSDDPTDDAASAGGRDPSDIASLAADRDVFIESFPDDTSPYVQQGVGWVVRLYSAQVLTGTLSQETTPGASIQRIDDKQPYHIELGGRVYSVYERRYLLVPERSGPLTIPGARFDGNAPLSLFDEVMGKRSSRVAVRAEPTILNVKPAPADAPQPWLPLHDLTLSYQAQPASLQLGSAATLKLQVIADGATAAQMPELQLPEIDGLQILPEVAQADESSINGRPRTTLTRAFSLVPTRTGKVHLDGVKLVWWDVARGAARTAQLPALTWDVSGAAPQASTSDPLGIASAPSGPAPAGSRALPMLVAAGRGVDGGWALAAMFFAGLWLVTLVWALHLRMQLQSGETVAQRGSPGAPATRGAAAPSPAALKQALDTGHLDDVAQVLRDMARPPAADLDELIARLDDSAQREALQALQRARWGSGDGVAARAQLRTAFASGPRWKVAEATVSSVLPPLYPDRSR